MQEFVQNRFRWCLKFYLKFVSLVVKKKHERKYHTHLVRKFIVDDSGGSLFMKAKKADEREYAEESMYITHISTNFDNRKKILNEHCMNLYIEDKITVIMGSIAFFFRHLVRHTMSFRATVSKCFLFVFKFRFWEVSGWVHFRKKNCFFKLPSFHHACLLVKNI